jgi:hypothetical protein
MAILRPKVNRRAAGISGLPVNLAKDYIRKTVRGKKGLFSKGIRKPSLSILGRPKR